MTIDELTTELGKLVVSGLNLLGSFEYVQVENLTSSAFGIKLELPPATIAPEEDNETNNSSSEELDNEYTESN